MYLVRCSHVICPFVCLPLIFVSLYTDARLHGVICGYLSLCSLQSVCSLGPPKPSHHHISSQSANKVPRVLLNTALVLYGAKDKETTPRSDLNSYDNCVS